VYGEGSIAKIGERARAAGFRHAFIVTDPGVRAAGLLEAAIASLSQSHLAYTVFDRVTANPRIGQTVAGAQAMRDSGADFALAIGGGSAMDAAKAIALVHANGGDPRDYMAAFGGHRAPKPITPLYTVPTTCGSGAEVTAGAVLTDEESKQKTVLFGCAPSLAVLDPQMVYGLPVNIVASTGVDALTHAVESYLGPRADALTRTFSVQAVRLVAASLRDAVNGEDRREALARMLYAASIAGHAMIAGAGQVHALAHPLGGRLDVPHGVANGVLLTAVLEHHLELIAPQLADLALLMGENVFGLSVHQAGKRAVEAMARLREDVGLPSRLSGLGVNDDDIQACAGDALGPAQRFSIDYPAPVTFDEVLAIYRRAM